VLIRPTVCLHSNLDHYDIRCCVAFTSTDVELAHDRPTQIANAAPESGQNVVLYG
jgi:hypothetical protein